MTVVESNVSLKQLFSRSGEEIGNIHRLSPHDLLFAISCPGFEKVADTENFKLLGEPRETGLYRATGLVQEAIIPSKFDNEPFTCEPETDLDNTGICIRAPHYTNEATPVNVWGGQYNPPIIALNLRDRGHDGTPESTNPYYHSMIVQTPDEQIPLRSEYLPYTNWYYSSPGDKPLKGTRPLEISILSADPQQSLANFLIQKSTLYVNPIHLLQFIDNPFAHIPDIRYINNSLI